MNIKMSIEKYNIPYTYSSICRACVLITVIFLCTRLLHLVAYKFIILLNISILTSMCFRFCRMCIQGEDDSRGLFHVNQESTSVYV